MKKLETEFTYKSFRYKQIQREGRFAIYEQWLRDRYVVDRLPNDPPEGDILYGYEVIVIGELEAAWIVDRDYPEREMYPSSEQWGDEGFTYRELSKANEKFEQLKKKYKFIKENKIGWR